MIPVSILEYLFQTSAIPLTIIITIIIIITVFLFSLFYKRRALNLPPSPPRLPLVGNLHLLKPIPHRALQSLSQKYGDLMLVHFGSDPTIIVSSAELAKEILKTHGANFSSRLSWSTINKLMYNSQGVGSSPYGEYWRNVRRICVDHLLSTKRVHSYHSVREEEVALLVEKIRASSPGTVNLSDMIFNLTVSIISREALGRKYEDDGNKFKDMVIELIALVRSFPCRDFIPLLGWVDTLSGLDARVRNNSDQMDTFLETVLDEHLRDKSYLSSDDHKEYMDFVDVLLSLKDDNLKRVNIKALVLDMFAGGTYTTFKTMESMMAELVKHPDVMARVQQELIRVVGPEGKVREEDLDKLDYFNAVIKETFRLHPATPLMLHRETTQDVRIGGYDFPNKTKVIVNIWAIGRDPRSWEKPDEFWPDRFLNSDIDFKGQHFDLIPFGSGRRVCPGVGLAVATVRVTIANLLLHFDWEIPYGMKADVRELSETLGSSPQKKLSLLLLAKPRVS